jgi:hypothetical protein
MVAQDLLCHRLGGGLPPLRDGRGTAYTRDAQLSIQPDYPKRLFVTCESVFAENAMCEHFLKQVPKYRKQQLFATR